jgi:hypothetical protein
MEEGMKRREGDIKGIVEGEEGGGGTGIEEGGMGAMVIFEREEGGGDYQISSC